MPELEYFELLFANCEWICIRGTAEPTIEEAQEFVAQDSKRIGAPVTGVFPIDEQTARACYDFSNEANWPIFSKEGDA